MPDFQIYEVPKCSADPRRSLLNADYSGHSQAITFGVYRDHVARCGKIKFTYMYDFEIKLQIKSPGRLPRA